MITAILPKLQSAALLIALSALSAFLYGKYEYTKGYNSGKDSVKAEYELKQEIQDEQRRIALEAVAKELANIEVKNVTINRKAITEVRDNVVYRECVVPDSGVQLLKEANKPR